MSDIAPIADDQLARLRAVAEDPLIAPSKRIEAIRREAGSHGPA